MVVKVAIIGAGNIGRIHAEVCSKISNVHIAGIVDREEETAKNLACTYKTKYFTNLDMLLKKENIDIAAICTPTYLHPEMVEKIAKAKVNIFCEKPLALTIEEADKMIKIVRENQVKAIVGYVVRFWPEYIKARDIIISGELGKPLSFQCERLASIHYRRADDWKLKEEMSGGAALDMQTHDLDFLICLFGIPAFIKSVGVYDKKLAGWAQINTILKFKNEINGFVNAGWYSVEGFPFTIVLRILCEKGIVEWIYRSSKGYEGRTEKFPLTVYKSDGLCCIEKVRRSDPYYLEWKYFIDCIINNKQVDISNFEEARTSLSVTLKTIDSCKESISS